MATTQERLDKYYALQEKVSAGVVEEYTEAGERVRLPKLSEVQKLIESHWHQPVLFERSNVVTDW